MLDQVLLVIHIAVLGYWLGADLVINSTYRYVCWSAGMPFDERNRLMDAAAWTEVGEWGSTPEREADVRQGYIRASAVLLGLWVLIGGIVVLSVWKPG